MQYIFDFLWKIDYPFTLTVVFLAFYIPMKKRKHSIFYLIGGLLVLFGGWYLRTIPIFDEIALLVSVLYLLEIVILFFVVLFSLDVDVLSALFILTCIISIQHLSFKISLQIINFIDINLYHSNWVFLFSYSILSVVFYLSYLLFSKKLITYVNFSNTISVTIALILTILIVLFFSIIEQQFMFLDIPNRLLLTTILNFLNIFITISILAFLYTTAISLKRKEEALAMSLISKKEKERFEMARVTIDEINIKYHDLKHMLKNSELNDEDKKEIQQTVTNYKAIIQTKNIGLDVVVYEAQLKCISLGIDLNVLTNSNGLEGFKPHHVYSLLSNLLDNAIEAVSKIEDESKRRISLKIQTVRQSTVIIVENYTQKKPKMRNGLPITSKKDVTNHGYGLKSVKRITDLYAGILSIKVDNDIFTVKIIFPLKENDLS